MQSDQALLSPRGAGPSAKSTRYSENPIHARHNIKLPSDHEYRVVQVYLPDEQLPAEQSSSSLIGVWTKEHSHFETSPTTVWIYDKGNEPPGLEGSRHVHSVWGFKPGVDPDLDVATPSELWFYTPGEVPPSYFTPRGVWTLPLIIRDVSKMKPHETGFVNVGKKVKEDKMDVEGNWKVLYQKGGLDGGDTRKGPGMKKKPANTTFQISVRTPDGKKIPLMVKPNDDIATVKTKVEKKTKVTPENQNLFHKGTPLNDDDGTLQDLKIKNGDVLDLIPNMTLYVERSSDGSRFALPKVKSTDMIKSIKRKVKDQTGIPTAEQNLYFKNRELNHGNDTLQDLGIRDQDTLKLDDGSGEMVVNIQNVDNGNVVSIKIKPTETLESLQQQIEKSNQLGNIPIEEQVLTTPSGTNLANEDEDDTMEELGINDGDTLQLEGMKVNAKLPNGTVIPLRVKPTDKIQNLKKKIKNKANIPINQQHLKHRNKPLDDNDNESLQRLGIKHGDTINVDGMTINVKTPEGDLVPVMVTPDDTIQDLKKKIQKKVGVPAADQFLKFNGQDLDDPSDTLDDVGIGHGDTVDLGAYKIKVKTPNGNVAVLNGVKPTDTLMDVKKKIKKQIGAPIKEQHLSHKGNDLDQYDDNDTTLDDVGVANNDVIDLSGMIINAQTPDGKIIPIHTRPSDTVEDIKKQVKSKTGIPVKEQKVVFNGEELPDNQTLDDAGIEHGDTVNVEQVMKVNVRKPDGKTFEVETSPNETVDDIKRKVKRKTNIPMDDQRLAHKGVELNDPDDTLEECGIKHGDTLDLSTDIEIKVKTLDGKLFPITIAPNASIMDVKAKVLKKENIPIKQQRLMDPDDDEVELEDHTTLKQNGVKHGDVLALGPMQIYVNTPDGGQITLDVDPNDSIEDVKRQIKRQEGIPVDDQFLFYKGKQLDDNDVTLAQAGVTHGSTLDLEGMKIFVTNPNDGSKIPLDVSPNDNIGDVKNQVADKTGTPANAIKLMRGDDELDDDKATLKGLGINYGDNLDMGGMQITIACPGGRYLPLQVKASDTLGEIKQRIENHVFVPVGIQRLLLKDELLEDNDMTLQEYGIKNGTLLDLRGMIIHVNFAAKNKKFSLEVIPTWSILDVKRHVCGEAPDDIPDRDLMKLLKGTKELTNKPNLKYYKIEHQETLELELIPTYNVEMSAWQSPFGYQSKGKIKREGVRARKGPGKMVNLMDSP